MVHRFLLIVLLCGLAASGRSSAFLGEPENEALARSLSKMSPAKPQPPVEEGFLLKPAIGLGVGNFTFFGDISNNHKGFHPTVSRVAYQLRVTHPLNAYLELDFHTIFGRVSANERSLTRNMNFESRIRMGGFQLTYNFDHLLKPRPKRHAEPFIGVGIESFEFLSKTDKYDAYGNEYHYWTDGSIRNLPESAPNAGDAVRIFRDYTYETDLREQNLDGNGKYPERSWAFPVSAGVTFYTGDNFKFRLQSTMHFTTTDLVDDITGQSLGDRIGTKGNDKILFTSFYVSYDLQAFKKEPPKDIKPPEIWEEPLFALDTFDTDMDGIVDFQDPCPYTPKGVEVDARGCPLDLDGDGVADYKDDEKPSPSGSFVNERGVALSDEDLNKYWNIYYDSTGQYSGHTDSVRTTTYSEGGGKIFGKPGEKDLKDKEYVIVLDKKEINVKANELHKYLGYQDFKTIQRGDTVFYVISGFKDLASAVKTNKDLKDKGIDTDGVHEAGIGKTGENVVNEVKDSEIKKVDPNAGEVKSIVPDGSQEIVYRVQIAAYTRPVSSTDRTFEDVPDLTQIKGADGLVRYYSGSFTTLEEASKHKIDMAYETGFKDAFVVAMRGGKRISLREITEVREDFKEGIDEYNKSIGEGIDPNQIRYRIELGSFKGDIPTETLELYLSLGNVKPVKDGKGTTHYVLGDFGSAGEAELKKKELQDEGIESATVVGDYMGRIMSLEEIIELLKSSNK